MSCFRKFDLLRGLVIFGTTMGCADVEPQEGPLTPIGTAGMCTLATGGTTGADQTIIGNGGTTSAQGATRAVGGSTAAIAGSVISKLFSKMDVIKVNVNLSDGFIRYENALYTIDVDSGRLTYEYELRDYSLDGQTTQPTHEVDTVNVTPEEIKAFVAVVGSTEWREQSDCLRTAIDGGAYPPKVTIYNEQTTTHFGVSNAPCASSDHSASGKVMSCEAFGATFATLSAMYPGGKSVLCKNYW